MKYIFILGAFKIIEIDIFCIELLKLLKTLLLLKNMVPNLGRREYMQGRSRWHRTHAPRRSPRSCMWHVAGVDSFSFGARGEGPP
jgi:hypothetical protein